MANIWQIPKNNLSAVNLIAGLNNSSNISKQFWDKTAPTIALDIPVDAASTSDTTPTFEFTGTDNLGNDIEYQVQIDTVNTFKSLLDYLVYTTWDFSKKSVNVALSGSSLIASGTNVGMVRAIDYITGSQQKYWEVTLNTTDGNFDVFMGICNSSANFTTNLGSATTGRSIAVDGGDYYNNGFVGVVTNGTWPATAGMVMRFALDLGAGTLKIWQDSTQLIPAGGVAGDPIFTGLTGDWFPAISIQTNTVKVTANFGATAFSATPPTDHTGVSSSVMKPLLSEISETANGFLNVPNGADLHPFTNAEEVSYTVQAGDALSVATYYWRVRAKDPKGFDDYGTWSAVRSFTITSGGGSAIKTVLGLIKASVKTWDNTAFVGIKSINGLQ